MPLDVRADAPGKIGMEDQAVFRLIEVVIGRSYERLLIPYGGNVGYLSFFQQLFDPYIVASVFRLALVGGSRNSS